MTNFLSNTPQYTHVHKIGKLFSEADAVYIMVAFLKKSGLLQITPHLAKIKEFKIIAGANFGITEPEALSILQEYSDKYSSISAFLNRLDSKIIFHPKMYLFRKGNEAHIIIGSANLTKGGLIENNECSLYHKCRITDQVWIDAYSFFNSCIKPERADLLNSRIIAQYRDYFKKQKLINDQAQGFPDMDMNIFYDLEKLKSHFDRLDKKKVNTDLQLKKNYYEEAKNILDNIALHRHSNQAFKEMIENLVGKAKVPGLWYSNGMFRGKERIFLQQEKFRSLLINIKNNLNKQPRLIYDEARAISKKIHQLGPNYIGEIMMTYAPNKLANINRNPITVLREEGGVDLKSHSQSFNGKDYEEYNSIVKEITFKLGLKDMMAADYFFNEIYQNLKKTKNSQLSTT